MKWPPKSYYTKVKLKNTIYSKKNTKMLHNTQSGSKMLYVSKVMCNHQHHIIIHSSLQDQPVSLWLCIITIKKMMIPVPIKYP